MILPNFLVKSGSTRWLTIFKFNNIVRGKSLANLYQSCFSYEDSAAFVTLCSGDEKVIFPSSEFHPN